MKLAVAVAAFLGTVPALAQEDVRFQEGQARQRASEVRLKCSGVLGGLEGVTSVSVGGAGSDYRLILVVRDFPSKMAARELLGGDVYDGLKILWTVTSPAGSTFASTPAPAASSPALTSSLFESPTLKAAPSVAPSFRFAPSTPATSMSPAGPGAASGYQVETKRTFWAGPGTLSTRRSRYSAYASCMPSRHAIWVAQCTPTTTPTYGYSYPQGNTYRPAGSCGTQYGYGWSNWTPATYSYSRPGVAPSGGYGGYSGASSSSYRVGYSGASYRPGLGCAAR